MTKVSGPCNAGAGISRALFYGYIAAADPNNEWGFLTDAEVEAVAGAGVRVGDLVEALRRIEPLAKEVNGGEDF